MFSVLCEAMDLSEAGPEDLADAEALAGDVLKRAYDLLRRRDWFIIGHQPGPEWDSTKMTTCYGLEATENAANVVARKLGYGIYRVTKVHGLGSLEQDSADHEAAAHVRFDDIPCSECGHRQYAHGATKMARGKVVPDRNKRGPACSVNCKCLAYQSKEA